MFKLLTIQLTICCIVHVQSCSKTQSTSTPKIPSCSEYKYMRHGIRRILSDKPNNLKMGQLSLAGTHQSLSKGLDPKLQTQELSITDQLKYGVRVLEISVSPLFNVFRIFVDTTCLNITFGSVLQEIDEFLHDNPLEFIILILNYDGVVNFDKTECDDNCDFIDYYTNNDDFGWRLVKQWSLNDIIRHHRGKILLATTSSHFRNNVFYLNDRCLILNNHVSSVKAKKGRVKATLEYKWNKYVELTKNSTYENYSCYVYDLSVNANISLIREISKYGGYYHNEQCIEPMNYRFNHYYPNIRRLSLRIILFDYITQEAIDHVSRETITYL